MAAARSRLPYCRQMHNRAFDALHGLQCVVRGKPKRTTVARDGDPRPLDLVKRKFSASRPNQVWVADFTYVATDRLRLCRVRDRRFLEDDCRGGRRRR